MKKITIWVFIMFCMQILTAETITQTYYFEKPEIFSYNGYHKIEMNELICVSEPGSPELPAKPVKLLLPSGEQAASVSITYKGINDISGEFEIYPRQKPYPTSYQDKIEFTQPDPEIYNSKKSYPEKLHTEVQTQYLKGHSIAILNIFPVTYIPATGKVSYFLEMKVVIETEPTDEAENSFLNFYRTNEITKSRVKNIIDNPEQIEFYPANSNTRAGDNKYVIITSSTYSSSFASFADFKNKQGYNVLIKTTEDIYSDPLYNGVDNQDEIRNFIKYAYLNLGTEYVLLGGDVEIVPHRGFWINAGGTEDYDIPADLYYAALDRVGTGTGPDWNVNNDTKWGETSEADYYAEVYIGRISADSGTEFSAALNKQIMYQQSPVASDLENAIMVGENLNTGPLTWGGTYKDEIMNGGTYNGYTTTGFSGNFTVQTQYDRDGYWSWTALQSKMNDGTNIINHLGHANPDFNMNFYRSYVTNSNLTSNGTNHNFYIIYTQGCYPASFDNRWSDGSYDPEDCIGEKFTTISNGCVAFIGNSRYGWYNPGGTNSGSQYLDRQFFDALFGENIYKLGEMNDDSKEDGASQCNSDPWFRWSYYCVNLLGDPSIDVWTNTPGMLSPSYTSAINISDTQLAVNAGVSGALVGLSQDGNHIGHGITDGTGNVTIVFDNSTSVGTMDIYITVHNYNIYIGTIQVISNEPYVVYNAHNINDPSGNNNGEADYGESVTLDMTLENVGTQNAYNVNATLSTTDSYITITDNSQTYGTIIQSSTSTQSDAFAFTIDSNIPDQHIINFDLEVTGTSSRDTWNSSFQITVNAPEITIDNMIIDDSLENNNGRLDPGETVDLIIPTNNDGHSNSPSAIGTISCTNEYITINGSDTYNYGVINASSTENAVFNITVASYAPIGTNVSFDYDVTAGSYSANETFNRMIGLVFEDFETGNFYSFPWEFAGSADWSVVTELPYEGTYCVRSGPISHSQTSELILTADVTTDGTISFYRKVSSESGGSSFYDGLIFFIDGVEQDKWQGEVAWNQVSFPVSAGTRTFKWVYDKDPYVSSGSDCAWIDYIIFPSLDIPQPADIIVSPSLFEKTLQPGNSTSDVLTIGNTGGVTLDYTARVVYLERNTSLENHTISESNNSGTDYYSEREIKSHIIAPLIKEVPNAGFRDCTFTIDLYDDYGDGWNGGSLDVMVNSLVVLDDITLATGSGPVSFDIPIATGDSISTAYTAGSWAYENNYFIYDNDGVQVASDGTGGVEPTGLSPFAVTCTNDPTLAWLTLDGQNQVSGSIDPDSPDDVLIVLFDTVPDGLTDGIYEANIEITNNDPDETTITVPVSLTVSSLTPPNMPTNVMISISGSDLTISWDAVTGATSYKVYSSDDPYTGFVEDTSGSFAGESWSTSVINEKKFYYVTAEN